MCEVLREYYENGELESECFLLNGKMHGEYKLYRKNGCELDDNGQLKKHYNYNNGIKQ